MYLGPPFAKHGKTFTKSEPAFQAAMTSVGVKAPGKTTTLAPQRKVDDLKIEPRRGQEGRSRIQAAARRFHAKQRAGAHKNPGVMARQFANDLDGARDGHGHFDDGNGALADRFRGKQGVLGGSTGVSPE